MFFAPQGLQIAPNPPYLSRFGQIPFWLVCLSDTVKGHCGMAMGNIALEYEGARNECRKGALNSPRTSMKEPIYIVDGVRTPFAKAGTTLAESDAVELGKTALSLLVARTGIDPSQIEEVILGCVSQPAESANIGRVVALRAGIPDSVPAITVHRNCASGCEAVTQAAEKMLAGRGDIFVVGGIESMSQIPLLYSHEAAKKFGAFARAKNLSQKLSVLSSFRAS